MENNPKKCCWGFNKCTKLDSESKKSIRNGIINVLELWASKERQLDYQKRSPIADVSSELFCQWIDDCYHLDSLVKGCVFSGVEIAALEEFNEVILQIASTTPIQLPNIDKFMLTEEWKRVHLSAIKTLGKLDR